MVINSLTILFPIRTVLIPARKNDLLFLDGTFYEKSELNKRNIDNIPHPSILETLELFKDLDSKDRNKIYFTHLNHTNNLLRSDSVEYKYLLENNLHILKDRMIFIL